LASTATMASATSPCFYRCSFSEIMTHVRLFLVPHHLGVGFLRLFNAKQSELLRTILPVLDLVSSTVAQTKVSPKQLPPSPGTVNVRCRNPRFFLLPLVDAVMSAVLG